MKTKAKELDVDFIGGNSSLTKDEEKALSSFFLAKKNKLNNLAIRQSIKVKKRTNILEKV
jgi:hypothetical protein